MSVTVDPIVKEEDKLISSEPGCVVVAKGKRGYRTFLDDKGPTFGERMFAGFGKYYLVDVSEKEITDSFDAGSNKGALKFQLTVEYYVAIERGSADKVVQDAIRDLGRVFRDPLRRHLSAVARQCDVRDINGAQDKLDAAMDAFLPADPRFKFRHGYVTVTPEKDTTDKVRTIDSEALDISHGKVVANVTGQEIARQEKLLQSDESLLAAYQATGEVKYLEALKLKLGEKNQAREARLHLMHKMIEKGYLEEFDIPDDLRKDLVTSLLAGVRSQKPAGAVEDKSKPEVIDAAAEIVETDSKPSGS